MPSRNCNYRLFELIRRRPCHGNVCSWTQWTIYSVHLDTPGPHGRCPTLPYGIYGLISNNLRDFYNVYSKFYYRDSRDHRLYLSKNLNVQTYQKFRAPISSSVTALHTNSKMPTAPVDNNGTELYFEESGPVPNSTDYTTLVIYHGSAFTGSKLASFCISSPRLTLCNAYRRYFS